MINTEQFQAKPLPLPLASPVQPMPPKVDGNNQIKSNGSSLFGKDGFTFFDFLDIINPLQHIPVISTIYRSLTGDQIDPGSKIAGGTIFGGPLGTVLASIDVAIEQKTGQDIANHAITFFATNNGSNHNDGHRASNVADNKSIGLAAAPAGNLPIEAAILPTESVVPNPMPFKAAQATPIQFNAAGMTAIPIAKPQNTHFGQRLPYVSPMPPDLGLLGQINQLTSQPQSTTNPSYDSAKFKARQVAGDRPYDLTPRFTAQKTANTTTKLPKFENQRQKNVDSLRLAVSNAKSGWVADAILKGLGKYEAVSRMRSTPPQSTFSVTR